MIINNLFKSNFKSEINKFIKKKDGLILLISTDNYQQFLKPILSSASLFANKWAILLVKIGKYELRKENKTNQLISTHIDLKDLNLENIDKNQFKSVSANIRGPIIYELCKYIKTKQLIYTDVDALIVRDLSNFFKILPTNRKIVLRKIKKNWIDYLRPKAKHYPYKGGCIALKTQRKFLNQDPIILEFSKQYSKYCWDNKFIWAADQDGLKNIADNFPEIDKFIKISSLLVDWSFKPWSYIWAAKGFRKNASIWDINSKLIIFSKAKENFKVNLKILKIKFSSKIIKNIVLIAKTILYPLAFLRFEIIYPLLKISNYCLKSILKIIKK